MPTFISQPTRIRAAGNKPKLIDEYIGSVNSSTDAVSVAHMRSPQGWSEPGQTPQFDEFTIVLAGMVRVTHKSGQIDVRSGQAIVAHKGGGCSTRHPTKAERSTSRCVCQCFRWRRFIGTELGSGLSALGSQLWALSFGSGIRWAGSGFGQQSDRALAAYPTKRTQASRSAPAATRTSASESRRVTICRVGGFMANS